MEDKKIYYCSVSGKVIPEARVEFLKDSNIPEERWTTVENSKVTRKKGIYTGEKYSEDGVEEAGELKIVDQVYNDTVRSVLRSAALGDDPDDITEEEKDEL